MRQQGHPSEIMPSQDADPHTLMCKMGAKRLQQSQERFENEKQKQQREDPYLGIFLDRWDDPEIAKVARGETRSSACDQCRKQRKSCTNELPACASCVRRKCGSQCNYSLDLSKGFNVHLARNRVRTRHERMYATTAELTYNESLALSIANIGIEGTPYACLGYDGGLGGALGEVGRRSGGHGCVSLIVSRMV